MRHHLTLAYRKGQKSEYTGGRSENDIVNWVLKRVGPPSTETTCAALKDRADATKLAVAYIGDTSAKEFSEVFLEVAQNGAVSEKYQFFHVNDASCAGNFGASGSPALILFRKFDTPTVVYSGSWESTPVVDWLQASSVPTLITFGEDFIEPIFGQRKAAIFLFRSASDADSSFAKVFAEAASKLKGEILFVVSGASTWGIGTPTVNDHSGSNGQEAHRVNQDEVPRCSVLLVRVNE